MAALDRCFDFCYTIDFITNLVCYGINVRIVLHSYRNSIPRLDFPAIQ